MNNPFSLWPHSRPFTAINSKKVVCEKGLNPKVFFEAQDVSIGRTAIGQLKDGYATCSNRVRRDHMPDNSDFHSRVQEFWCICRLTLDGPATHRGLATRKLCPFTFLVLRLSVLSAATLVLRGMAGSSGRANSMIAAALCLLRKQHHRADGLCPCAES
jgi:hypothetical protein